jgi:hypothetical protein
MTTIGAGRSETIPGSAFFCVLLYAFDLEFGGGGASRRNALGGLDGLHVYKGCHRFDDDSFC